MRRIDTNDFKVFVNTILVDPVRVQDSQVGTLSSDSLFSGGSQRPLVFEVVDTMMDRLSESGTLGDWLFTVTTTDTDTVDEETLLGLVT